MQVSSIRPVASAPVAPAAPLHQLDALREGLANPFAFASEASCPWGKPEPKPRPQG